MRRHAAGRRRLHRQTPRLRVRHRGHLRGHARRRARHRRRRRRGASGRGDRRRALDRGVHADRLHVDRRRRRVDEVVGRQARRHGAIRHVRRHRRVVEVVVLERVMRVLGARRPDHARSRERQQRHVVGHRVGGERLDPRLRRQRADHLAGERAHHVLDATDRAPRLGRRAVEVAHVALEVARGERCLRLIGDRFDRLEHLVRAAPAIARILRQCSHDEVVDAARQGGVHRRWRRRIEANDRGERLVVRAALERADVRHHLVEHDAEREQIAAVIDLVGLALLGREVRDLAHDRTGLGLRVAVARLGDAEVEHLHDAVEADHEVRGRDIAMHDV